MTRKTFARMNCSIAQSLEVIGEWWSVLILREAFMGTRRFRDFEHNLAIAKNILAARLRKLVRQGVLRRVAPADGGKHHEYRLTEKGRALYPVITALRVWGDRWVLGADKAPIKVVDRRSGKEVDVQVVTEDGQPVDPRDVMLVPGPGATKATKERLESMSAVRNPTAARD